MLTLSNNVVLIQHPNEFRIPETVDTFYGDVETKSGNPKLDSLNPWKIEQCRVNIGAFTWDNEPKIYVVPAGLMNCFLCTLEKATSWCNHNVKYDTHVLSNNYKAEGFSYEGKYIDTLTFGKIIDSDLTFKGGYGLDNLSKLFLDIDLSEYYNSLNPYLRSTNGKIICRDYGEIPTDILADYAGNQVRANRLLYHKFNELLPESCERVWKTEQRLTTTLVAAERRGMLVNLMSTKVSHLKALRRMIDIQDRLKEKLGYECNPKSHKDCEDLFINRLGLPAIYKPDAEEDSGPSFDKHVLKMYSQIPDLEETGTTEIVELVQEYRHLDTMQGLFYAPWQDLNVKDDQGRAVLHSDNNQCVRTGRMSCSDPNNQQFNDDARQLIEPREGFSFVVHDYSQIEYRFIAHYIRSERLLKAYEDNPDIDFHQLQADGVGIERDPAKTMNFAVSFGQGKKRTLASLMVNKSIIKQTGGDAQKIRELAEFVYNEFFRKMPELKPHRRMAENAARMRGYVCNDYGRRRHLSLEFAHRGFPSVVQSHAADLIKERVNALDEVRHQYGAHIIAIIHDEVLSEVPTENASRYAYDATEILNASSIPVRVPIRCKCGVSHKNWLAAKKGEK